ncbi:MAG: stage V sporulation protein T [Selenomonadales bacterium]|nr:stage V sporulation protein T [Selenomonadales bacterium]
MPMKATGIVRRIDDLGRVVVPKEIRRTLRIREGDPLEIYVEQGGEIILKKYSPVNELGTFAKEYCDSLFETSGHIALIADREQIVAASGAGKKDFLHQPIGMAVENVMEGRRTEMHNDLSEAKQVRLAPVQTEADTPIGVLSQVLTPIIVEGDAIGAVILCTRQPGIRMGDTESKLTETAAGFLSKQMSQ